MQRHSRHANGCARGETCEKTPLRQAIGSPGGKIFPEKPSEPNLELREERRNTKKHEETKRLKETKRFHFLKHISIYVNAKRGGQRRRHRAVSRFHVPWSHSKPLKWSIVETAKKFVRSRILLRNTKDI